MSSSRIHASDWLLAEAVRLYEEHNGRSRDDQTANTLARDAGGGFGRRLARRAAALPVAAAVRSDLARLRRLLARLAVLLLVLGALAGVLAALASTAEREVDVLLAAVSLLLLPSLMLLMWASLMLLTRPARASASLSGGLVGLGLRRLGPRLLEGPLAGETVSAMAGLLATSAGRWLLATIAHAFWVVYSLAALLVLTILFSAAQYDLSWGTTLLSEQAMVDLISGLAWFPAALGLVEQPSADWILAGRKGVEAGAVRAEWARFLMALVAVYGLLPRLLLAILSGVLGRLGLGRMVLDTTQPGYLRLAGSLLDEEDALVHGDQPPSAPAVQRRRQANADGPPLLVGVELERKQWPVELPGLSWQALGRADSRDQRRQILAAVEGFLVPPSALIAQCSALRTPDEGTGRFLAALADRADTVLVVWLDEIDRLESRGVPARERIADWLQLTARVGGRLVVLDADRPDSTALAELFDLVGAEQ
ncbi:MAG: DUF2868 domain-containing protein [Wenzhouxiangella sp.]|nr:MAG: DUF2868 domain-containing protein [Wenzhouxiangella sp.]